VPLEARETRGTGLLQAALRPPQHVAWERLAPTAGVGLREGSSGAADSLAADRRALQGDDGGPEGGPGQRVLRLSDLTAAQRAVAVLAGAGNGRMEIARLLTVNAGRPVSPRTVDSHVKAIATRLHSGPGSALDRVARWAVVAAASEASGD
jgi:DNA-binding CsgD family transcriptional regulator